MTYAEATDYLFRAVPMFQRDGASAYKPGLDTIRALDDIFGHPHRSYATIHVGGTNGKGSTSHSLSSILQAAGYKVGLFTSPHLLDFRERIRVGGQMISPEAVVQYTEQFIPWVAEYHPSFFELTTMMALAYFRDQAVDYAVIEVGLGGRLDSTNIIDPLVSVVTNISLDHTQLLGDTLESIAREKAGIIKPNTPIVLGRSSEHQVYQVFEEVAHAHHAPLYRADQLNRLEEGVPQDGYTSYQGRGGRIDFALMGQIQRENLQTILTTVDILQKVGVSLPTEAIRQGLKQVISLTGLRGRWEQISSSPQIICDTAHNPDGIREVVVQLLRYNRPLRLVFGMARDKDVATTLGLLPREAIYYFTQAQGDRSLPADELKKLAQASGLQGSSYSSIATALAQARADWQEGELIFVGGSNFVIAELLDQENHH